MRGEERQSHRVSRFLELTAKSGIFLNTFLSAFLHSNRCAHDPSSSTQNKELNSEFMKTRFWMEDVLVPEFGETNSFLVNL